MAKDTNENKIKELRKELEAEIEDQIPKEDNYLKVEVEKAGDISPDDDPRIKRILEAMLFSSGRPLGLQDFKKVLQGIRPQKISRLVKELKEEYEKEGRSFRVIEVASGYEVSTEPRYAPWIMKLEHQKKVKQATQSALETLAILAYKQPATRIEIEELRGVDVSSVLSTLMERGFIKIAGKKEVPGRPFLYGTTDKFLEHFGLASLKDLPNISEIRSLVEDAVKKDELLKKEKIVENEDAQEPKPQPGEQSTSEGDTESTTSADDTESQVQEAISVIDNIKPTKLDFNEPKEEGTQENEPE